MIKISEIKIVPVESQNGLVGFASFVFENVFFMSSIGIFTCPSRKYRLTYPTRRNARNSLNFFYPINKKIAEEIESAVISKYEEVMTK